MAERIDWVDVAKGFCICFVVMMHSTLGVEKAAGATGWLGTVVERPAIACKRLLRAS